MSDDKKNFFSFLNFNGNEVVLTLDNLNALLCENCNAIDLETCIFNYKNQRCARYANMGK